MEASEGFPPVASADACVLVLGSLPGKKSLLAQQYYAHSQNAFWSIMRELFGIDGSYENRCAQLKKQKIALWDVLRGSVRPGSLDADIQTNTAIANDFGEFLAKHPNIRHIVFNGKKSEQLFHRLVPRDLHQHLCLAGLPSTSPAYAAMPFSAKLNAWRAGLETVRAGH